MTAYRKLFSVNVYHNYYEDNLCNDLSFVATTASRKTIINQRLLFKIFDSGFNIITEIGEDLKPKIEFLDTNLQFGIQLKNAAKFLAITQLNETAPNKDFLSNKKIYFSNNGLNSNLEYQIIDGIVGNLMSLDFTLPPANTEVNLRLNSSTENNLVIAFDTDGVPINGPYKIKVNSSKVFEKLLDMSKLPDGLYNISIKNAADTGNDLISYKIFKSNGLSAQSIFGVLELKLPASNVVVTETKFLINFLRKSTIWKYYVINQSGIDLDDFDLLVKDKSLDGTPSGIPAYAKYTFAGNPVPANDPDPINKIADADILLFKSNVKIPFYQKVKVGLELSKKDGGTEVILTKNLPNPMPEKQAGDESKIYVYV
ncbi:hypothetical protein [Pedobacter kyonggii]|uniref:Uncharacterized protein n=1 Tax=Pedobacter kyonggii TaxID=1926871 RepID=A0A4Q9HAJ0_9SPHI|nr:hypothetical protein [Pedobacter kyonggii]TBO41062.1 hypothetical protein EYS08_16150 [Pedobacter kyonggii]